MNKKFVHSTIPGENKLEEEKLHVKNLWIVLLWNKCKNISCNYAKTFWNVKTFCTRHFYAIYHLIYYIFFFILRKFYDENLSKKRNKRNKTKQIWKLAKRGRSSGKPGWLDNLFCYNEVICYLRSLDFLYFSFIFLKFNLLPPLL